MELASRRVADDDLVTIRRFNLYAELLELVGGADPTLAPSRSLLDIWRYPMALEAPLPMLPI